MVIEKEDDIKDALKEEKMLNPEEIKDMIKEVLEEAKFLDEDTLYFALKLLDQLRTNESMLRLVLNGTMKAKYSGDKNKPDTGSGMDDYDLYLAEDEEKLKKNPRYKKYFTQKESDIATKEAQS
ncbi:MAG: hypothetical protein Q8S44_02890 [Flavobacteriaceae bacterium]|nr:hypothetical protein [Flavobacteriaceae bacterium]